MLKMSRKTEAPLLLTHKVDSLVETETLKPCLLDDAIVAKRSNCRAKQQKLQEKLLNSEHQKLNFR